MKNTNSLYKLQTVMYQQIMHNASGEQRTMLGIYTFIITFLKKNQIISYKLCCKKLKTTRKTE
jgi:hypothetical protein